MKNKLLLATIYQFRRKSNLFNIFFIGIFTFLAILIGSYHSSSVHYMKYDIYDSFKQKTLIVTKSQEELEMEGITLDDVREDLNKLKHVTYVARFASFRNYLHSSLLEKEKQNGYVELYASNNSILPKIVKGISFTEENKYTMICPQNFFAIDNLEDLWYMKKKDGISTKQLLGQTIPFEYRSNSGMKTYTIELQVIGLYKNNRYHVDENVCYVEESILEEVLKNQYADDFDDENGVSNLVYQTDFAVQIDELENRSFVEKELIDKGYSVSPMSKVATEYFNEITKKMNNMTFGILSILFLFVLLVLQKKYKEEKKQYQLMVYLGYSKKDIRLIYHMSNIFNIIVSCLFALLISLVPLFLFYKILDIYPFLFHKWRLIVNYMPVLTVFIVSFVASFITSIFHTFYLFEDEND